MSDRDLFLLLSDILESASKFQRYTTGLTFELFENDDKTIDAVVRNLEIIGEASNRIDPDFKLRHPQIEWARMYGLRNRVIHAYFGVDITIVWNIIQEYLDDLIESIQSLISEEE